MLECPQNSQVPGACFHLLNNVLFKAVCPNHILDDPVSSLLLLPVLLFFEFQTIFQLLLLPTVCTTKLEKKIKQLTGKKKKSRPNIRLKFLTAGFMLLISNCLFSLSGGQTSKVSLNIRWVSYHHTHK